ncbi:hypothetical protein V8G69_01530 [Gaetbulibacter sp. M235]|uniref:hypothetical protein n=1 Tax=Gaetbulibacter sp. M235 TaxID=3126510 RepID=UPI00374F591C
MIKFFTSLKEKKINEGQVIKLLKKFEPILTEKKLNRLIKALNKYLTKEEAKILSKFSEEEYKNRLIEYELKHGYIPKRGGLSRSTNPGKWAGLSSHEISLKINNQEVFFKEKLEALYILKKALPDCPVVKPYRSLEEYFYPRFTKFQIKQYTSNIDKYSTLSEISISLAALFQNKIIDPPNDLLDILRAYCDFTKIPYKTTFEGNVYEYLNDKNLNGWVYKDISDPNYVRYDKKVSDIF